MEIPDKCMGCPHTVTRFERVCVKSSWQIEYVTRCGLDPLRHKVGCVVADMHCDRVESEDDYGDK